MARRYKVEGTKDFLYWAIGLILLGLWAVRDGWFPPPSVLERHPRSVPVAFPNEGVVAELQVREGDPVRPAMPLAMQIGRKELESRRAELTERLKTSDVAAESPERAALSEEIARLTREIEARELRAPTSGVVRAVLIRENEIARAKQPVIEIDPQDHFYAFNKSLAVVCFLGAIVCLIIHFKVR